MLKRVIPGAVDRLPHWKGLPDFQLVQPSNFHRGSSYNLPLLLARLLMIGPEVSQRRLIFSTLTRL